MPNKRFNQSIIQQYQPRTGLPEDKKTERDGQVQHFNPDTYLKSPTFYF